MQLFRKFSAGFPNTPRDILNENCRLAIRGRRLEILIIYSTCKKEEAVKDLFYPSSVVVIGVSTLPSNLGKEIARNLFEFRYTGVIHLAGRDGGILFGRKIHQSLDEINEPVDLAIILTPAGTVPGILEQCGRKGIKRAIIESGGFGEFDEQGRNLGDELNRIASKYDIRFIGPNCIGIMNAANGLTTPFTRLKTVFRRGGVGIVAQSGGVALSFLNMFDSEQLGFSKFASIGNKLNVDENDLLEYYVDDQETKVVCLYVESINDGRRFTSIGRRSPKPIVIHKANIGSFSSVIAQSHTAALANDDQVVDAALHQAGMVRFRDMQTYLDFVKILQLPLMRGRNLAIVSRSGGHAVIGADAAYAYGFQLPPFGKDFLSEIRKHLRADVVKLANPLDLGDLFDFDVYVRIIRHTLKEDNVDGVLLLHTYFAAIEGESSRRLLQSAALMSKEYDKPVALCVSTEQFEISRLHKEFDFPIFMSPERAVRALDAAIKYQHRRSFIERNSEITEPEPAPNYKSVAGLIAGCTREKRSPMLHEALEMISMAGLVVPDFRVIMNPSDVEFALGDMVGPYAIKIIASGVSHKSDLGGVILGLPDAAAVRQASLEMIERFRAQSETHFSGVLVQKMAYLSMESCELIIGGKTDPQFGPVVLLGHGGVFVEILAGTVLRMAPLSMGEIAEMIDELPGSEILAGIRGRSPINRDSLMDAISRVAHIMVHFPQINSMDINPIVVSSLGAQALDARIFLST